MALTPRQASFVEQYLVDLNATKAAIRAGYSKATAGAIGAENLTKPEIIAAVEAGKARLGERTGITKAWLAGEIAAGFRAAAAERHYAGMGRLGELLGKLHGFIVEKRDVRVIRSIEDLTDAELEAIAGGTGGGAGEHRH